MTFRIQYLDKKLEAKIVTIEAEDLKDVVEKAKEAGYKQILDVHRIL